MVNRQLSLPSFFPAFRELEHFRWDAGAPARLVGDPLQSRKTDSLYFLIGGFTIQGVNLHSEWLDLTDFLDPDADRVWVSVGDSSLY